MSRNGQTDECIKTIVRLWAGGRSAGDIASVVGISRSAVMGIVHRRKLAGGSCAGRPGWRGARRKSASPPSEKAAPAVASVVPATLPKSTVFLTAYGKAVRASIASVVKAGAVRAAKAKPEKPIAAPVVDPLEKLFAAPDDLEPWRRAGGVTIGDLREFDCKWIEGQPNGSDTIYCGNPRVPRSSYCECHRTIARGPGTHGERAALRLPSPREATASRLTARFM